MIVSDSELNGFATNIVIKSRGAAAWQIPAVL